MQTSVVDRISAVLLWAEGVGILALAGWELLALLAGDTGSVDSSVALLVLTAVGAVGVVAFGVAVWRGRSWGRSGGIVTQLLILAVALGAATGAYADPAAAVALAVPAVLVFALLIVGARNAATSARRDAAGE
ncbi:histidine kinase [Microbacterium thalassium]|uniref:Histidine kinase n=1 Tax=Microbacterium thalassium TaxID=362649 RepID=A0A7X0FPS8_9MICO|nr:histidine kinase [Microbacterium thalassium]MBB6391356.1 hypothetical protein [Microbacterium thalassium]GLK23347.1 hypothetical protein GCM10017607_06650 [Microbacterium thalassium]